MRLHFISRFSLSVILFERNDTVLKHNANNLLIKKMLSTQFEIIKNNLYFN